jgi:hypothetical protein
MCAGVSKSGSPALRDTMSRPAALSSMAFMVTMMVADGRIRSIRADVPIIDMSSPEPLCVPCHRIIANSPRETARLNLNEKYVEEYS